MTVVMLLLHFPGSCVTVLGTALQTVRYGTWMVRGGARSKLRGMWLARGSIQLTREATRDTVNSTNVVTIFGPRSALDFLT
jgi:hypothetical protein